MSIFNEMDNLYRLISLGTSTTSLYTRVYLISRISRSQKLYFDTSIHSELVVSSRIAFRALFSASPHALPVYGGGIGLGMPISVTVNEPLCALI
jgi:hypothetical protein